MNHPRGGRAVYGRSELVEAINALVDVVATGGSGGLIVEGPIGVGRSCAGTILRRVTQNAGVPLHAPVAGSPADAGLVWLGDVAVADLGATVAPVVGEAATGWVLTTAPRDNTSEDHALGPVTRIRLARLSPAQALAMAADRLGAAPTARQRVRVEAADGWPALIAATLHTPRALPAIAARMLDELTSPARGLARAAATLTHTVDGRLLSVVSGLGPVRLLEAMDELLAIGIMVDDRRGAVAFGSDLLRRLIAGTVAPGMRRQMRLEALRASIRPHEADTRFVAELALMLASGRKRVAGDERSLLLAAVDTLARTDPAGAGRLANRLVPALAHGDPDRAGLTARSIDLLGRAGETEEALAAFRRALADAPTETGRQTLSAMICGAPWVPIDDRIIAGSDAARLRLPGRTVDHEFDDAITLVRIFAGYPADPSRLSVAGRLGRAVLAMARGAFGDALTLLDETGRASDAGSAPSDLSHLIAMWRCEALMGLDRFDEAEHIIDAASSLAGEHALRWARLSWHLLRGRLAVQRGQLDAAADSLLRTQTGSPLHATTLYVAGELALRRGQPPETVRRAAQRAAGADRSQLPEPVRHARWFQALHAASLGRTSPPLICGLPTLWRDPLAELTLVRHALGRRDRDAAVDAVAAAQRRAEANPASTSLRAAAIHGRGLLQGETELLQASVAILAAGERRLSHADAVVDLAAHTSPDARIALLGEALSLYRQCGADRDAQRVRRQLRELGVRRRARQRTRPDHGWEALTPAELIVVRAIAAGSTNRAAAQQLTLSPHTVNAHLRRSYLKLGVSSRVELARVVIARDRPDGDGSVA